MPEAKREKLGPCRMHACEEGVIIKKTIFELAIPQSEVRIGGKPPPQKPIVSCYCNTCGVLYNPDVIENLNPRKTAP